MSCNLTMVKFIDHELESMLLELKSLEAEHVELLTKKNDYARQVSEFSSAYKRYVGPTLEKVLKQNLETEEERANINNNDEAESLKNAREEYEQFYQQLQEKTEPVIDLKDDELLEIKTMFRQASNKCHPDKLSESEQEWGKNTFQDLTDAYRRHDLIKVREIWNMLKCDSDTSIDTKVDDKEEVRLKLEQTIQNVSSVKEEIKNIIEGDVWKLIRQLDSDGITWRDYFAKL